MGLKFNGDSLSDANEVERKVSLPNAIRSAATASH